MMNGNEKTRSSPSNDDSRKVLQNGTKIRVRPYRKKDTDTIRSFYRLAMTEARKYTLLKLGCKCNFSDTSCSGFRNRWLTT